MQAVEATLDAAEVALEELQRLLSTGDSIFLFGICPILSGLLLGPPDPYFLVYGI